MLKMSTGFVALALSAWAGATAAEASMMDTVRCDGGDYVFNILLDPRQNRYVTLQEPLDGSSEPQDHKLLRVREDGLRNVEYAGSGFRFVRTGNSFDLYADDMAYACYFVPAGESSDDATNQLNAQSGGVVDVAGQSLGGKLRAGPGMEFRDIGSLREGAEIRILNNTGVAMNGYDWFQIELLELGAGHGAVYQWGGIMCSKGSLVPGIFTVCGQPPSQQTSSSQPTDPSAKFVALNNTGSPAELVYLPDGGNSEVTAVVPAYSSVTINSYLGHRFWLRKGDAIHGEFVVRQKKGGVFQINE